MSMPEDIQQRDLDPRRRFSSRERVALYLASALGVPALGCGHQCQRPTPSQAHCTTCHRTFGGVTGFDAHRVRGQCIDPATKGYSEINGIWRVPMDRLNMPKWGEQTK